MTPEELARAFPTVPFPTPAPAARKTRTLYVREEDQEIWDQAKDLAGESLSTFVTTQLKHLVAGKKAAQQGLEQLVVKFSENRVPRAKAFMGRWIIPPHSPFVSDDSDPAISPDCYAAAVTAKNKVAVFNFWEGSYDPEKFLPGCLHVFDTIEEAASFSHIPDLLVMEIMKRIGVEVQVLDI